MQLDIVVKPLINVSVCACPHSRYPVTDNCAECGLPNSAVLNPENDSQPFCSRANLNLQPGANRPIKPWPIRSLELSLLGTFAPWSIRSLALSLSGTYAPRSKMTLELSFR